MRAYLKQRKKHSGLSGYERSLLSEIDKERTISAIMLLYISYGPR